MPVVATDAQMPTCEARGAGDAGVAGSRLAVADVKRVGVFCGLTCAKRASDESDCRGERSRSSSGWRLAGEVR
jgi:hypothetical protein